MGSVPHGCNSRCFFLSKVFVEESPKIHPTETGSKTINPGIKSNYFIFLRKVKKINQQPSFSTLVFSTRWIEMKTN